jgi:cytochrome c-type biogenesis protein CcmH/NrfF
LAAVLVALGTCLAAPARAEGTPEGSPGKGNAAEAATPPLDGEQLRQAQSIARQTMSPFCPGRTLSDCPSEHAAAWRKEIQVMLARGATAQEIQQEFERRAGGDLSGRPHRGVGYGLSFGLAAASLALLFGVLRLVRARKPESAGAEGSGGPDAGAGATGAEPTDGQRSHDEDASAEARPVDNAALDERLDQELAAELGEDDER